MDLRAQFTIVRRHLLLIVQAVVLAALVAGLVAHSSRSVKYQAYAQVLLTPGDPTESITPTSPPADISGYSALQASLVTSPPVAVAVARDLHSSNPGGLASEVSAGGTNILKITATDANPRRAEVIVNAFANEYIAFSRTTMVDALKRAATRLKASATSLQAQLNAPVHLPTATRLAIQSQYQTVYTQYQAAIVNQSLTQGDAQLLSSATGPGAPLSTTPIIETVLFGALAGLLLGLGGAFLREQLDDRVRTREEAERASGGMPILADAAQNRRAVRLIATEGLETAMLTQLGETGRALRTAIMFFGVRREERRILVTSPAQGDGKTLVSTLLAAAYAQAGFRTILISADLRRPGLEELLGMDTRRHGLTDALLLTPETGRARVRRGEGDLSTYIQETPLANLSVLTAGSIPPNPVELLSSLSMEALLDELASSFDVLILDSAPLLPVSDTRTLVDKVDGVVLVTSIGQSKRNIARAQDTLRPADVKWLGLVLNRVPASDESPAYQQYRRRRPAKANRA